MSSEVARVTVNGAPATLLGDGRWTFRTPLTLGGNYFSVVAEDRRGNRSPVRRCCIGVCSDREDDPLRPPPFTLRFELRYRVGPKLQAPRFRPKPPVQVRNEDDEHDPFFEGIPPDGPR